MMLFGRRRGQSRAGKVGQRGAPASRYQQWMAPYQYNAVTRCNEKSADVLDPEKTKTVADAFDFVLYNPAHPDELAKISSSTHTKNATFRVVCIWFGNGGNQLLKIVNEDRSLLLFIWWLDIMSISSYSRQWLEWLDYYQTTGRINIDCQVPIYFRNDQIQNANNCILPSTIARVL